MTLGVICLRRAAAEGAQNKTGVDSLEGENSRTATDQWLQMIIFENILSTVNVVKASVAMHLLTMRLAWRRHQSQTIKTFQKSGTETKRVNDKDNTY